MLRSGKGWRSAEIRDGLGARRSGKGWACTKIREELGACEDQEWIQGAQRPRKGSEISWGHTRIGAWLEASKEGGWAGDGKYQEWFVIFVIKRSNLNLWNVVARLSGYKL